MDSTQIVVVATLFPAVLAGIKFIRLLSAQRKLSQAPSTTNKQKVSSLRREFVFWAVVGLGVFVFTFWVIPAIAQSLR